MSANPVEELLGAPLHIEAGILLGLFAREPRDALHEVEDALCGVRDYAEFCGRSACCARFSGPVCSA